MNKGFAFLVLFFSACEIKELDLGQSPSLLDVREGVFYEVDTGYRCQPYSVNPEYVYGLKGELRVISGISFTDGCSDAIEIINGIDVQNIQVLENGNILRFRNRNFIRFESRNRPIPNAVFEIMYPGYTCLTNTQPRTTINSYVDKIGFFETEMYLTGDSCNDAPELKSEFEYYLSYDEEFLLERKGIYKRNLLMSSGI